MERIRMFQGEKLKTSHFFLAIPRLTIVTAVKELRWKVFTQQRLPVYSITSIFSIMIFLLGRLICCTRQEPDKGERAGPAHWEAVLWVHSCTTQHTAGLQQQQPNGLRGALEALQALRGFLCRLPICPQFLSVFGRRKADQRSWEQAAEIMEGELNKGLLLPWRNGRNSWKAWYDQCSEITSKSFFR